MTYVIDFDGHTEEVIETMDQAQEYIRTSDGPTHLYSVRVEEGGHLLAKVYAPTFLQEGIPEENERSAGEIKAIRDRENRKAA